MAETFGAETAYAVVDGGALTFAEWDALANRLARGLVEAGVEPDDRVGIHLSTDNALRFLVSYTGIHRAGGVAVPLNSRLAGAEVARMLEHCEAKGVIADGVSVIDDATAGAASGFPALVVDATTGLTPAGAADPRVRSWDAVLADDAGAFQVPRQDDDLADILYTSGTTGTPKGVAVRHVNASLIPPFPPSWSGGVWLHASPMFTFAGLSFTYNPMKLGLQGLYMARFDAGRWLEVVGQARPVAVFLVPAMTHLLIDHAKFAETDLSSITICSVGSAPLAPFVIERLQEAMPDAMVSNNYGMTEAGSIFCITPQGEAVKRPGSVGQPAPPGEIRIVGPDGEALAPGEVGEVRLRSPVRPREYFADPEATKETWVDGWLVTGDLGKLDEDGYLYIVGRNKDVIIRGGNNVHAADVEHVIVSHDGVAEAAVVGAPHPVLGEDVVAFVALHPGAKVNPEELREFCLSVLADYKVPRQWRFVDALPRNATGKVVKAELRSQLEATS
jgi:acyl-CoA synthetase (AMP-forming)/AMP-acid ligase II